METKNRKLIITLGVLLLVFSLCPAVYQFILASQPCNGWSCGMGEVMTGFSLLLSTVLAFIILIKKNIGLGTIIFSGITTAISVCFFYIQLFSMYPTDQLLKIFSIPLLIVSVVTFSVLFVTNIANKKHS